MTKNITPFGKFKDIKNTPIEEPVEKVEEKVEEPVEKVDEMVEPINDMYRVSLDVDVPKSLINAYIKKVKDETNKDLRQSKSEMQLAEKIVQYVNENFIVIENLPVEMVASVDQKAVQSQVQQAQPEVSELPEEPSQVQVSQPGQDEISVQTQGQTQMSQGQAQTAAQEISAQEI